MREKIVPSKHVRLFFCCCLEISFRPQDVFGMLWCVGVFLFMSPSWLNTFTNQLSYLLDEQLECQKLRNQSSCSSFCVSVICSNFTQDFVMRLHIVVLEHWFKEEYCSISDLVCCLIVLLYFNNTIRITDQCKLLDICTITKRVCPNEHYAVHMLFSVCLC